MKQRCHHQRLLCCCCCSFWCWLSTTVSLHHHVQAQEPHVASTTMRLPPLVPLGPQEAKHWAPLAAAATSKPLDSSFEDKASVMLSSPHPPLRNTVSSTRNLHWRSSKPTSAPTRVPTSMAPTLPPIVGYDPVSFCSTAPNDGGLQCLYVYPILLHNSREAPNQKMCAWERQRQRTSMETAVSVPSWVVALIMSFLSFLLSLRLLEMEDSVTNHRRRLRLLWMPIPGPRAIVHWR